MNFNGMKILQLNKTTNTIYAPENVELIHEIPGISTTDEFLSIGCNMKYAVKFCNPDMSNSNETFLQMTSQKRRTKTKL